MSSSIPSRSTDPDPNRPDIRFRSLSLSNSYRSSNSVAREPLSQRSRTPKAKRKNTSNRTTPYTSPALSRSSQSRGSTITPGSNNQDFDNDADLSLTDIDIVHLSSQQNQLQQEQDAFEKSSGDENQDNGENTEPSDHMSIAKVKSHFTPSEKNKYICNICKESKTTNGSSTFNLRRHLAIRNQIDVGSDAAFERKKKKSPQIHPIVSSERREEIDNLLLQCIIYGGLPYNHFSHPWYDALIEKLEPGYRAPDRRTFKNRIQHKYNEYINELKQLLPKDRPIAYTTDVWKSPKRDYYICLTAHVFNDELKPVSLLLSFRRLTNRKLSKNLNEYISYELNRFGLKDCSHAGITTDNASDIKAATKSGEFGPRFPCVAHIFNLIINHGLSIWEKPDETKYPFKPYRKNTAFDDDDDDEDGFIDVNDDVEDEAVDAEQTFERIQLDNNNQSNATNNQSNDNNNMIMTSDINNPSPLVPTAVVDEDEFISDDEDLNSSPPDLSALTDNEKKSIFEAQYKTHNLLSRTRKLIKIIRNICAIDQYVRNHPDGPNNGFIIDIRTRWNSSFYMLNRVIHHQVVVKSVFIHKFPTISAYQRTSLTNVYLDHDNWNTMQALHDVLAPFELATRSLSGKHYVTLALAYTTINILKFGLQPKQDDSPYLIILKKSVRAQFELYFDVKMTKTQKELMLVASYLDPESHQQLSREDKQAAKTILPTFMKKEIQFNVGSSSSPASTVTKTTQTLTDKLKIMVGMSTSMKTSKSLTIEEELVLFTQAIHSFKGDFASFWLQNRERFTRLYRVAQRVNIVAATSVASESVFSIAGFVARKQRTSLSSKSLRHLMVLKESHRLDALRTISRNPVY